LKYREIVDGIFLDRPNRFIAHVDVNGAVETVHVKNTGRCRELLLPGTAVRPNVSTQPEFGTALAEAKAAGVQVLFLLCRVGRDSLEIVEQREGGRRQKNALRDSVTEIINRKCYHIDTRNTPITFQWRISI